MTSAINHQPNAQGLTARLPRRLGLSGKLLLLTIPLVMIAEILIYVPSMANFWTNRLNGRLAAALLASVR